MPCAKRMTGCHRRCLHRQLVGEYGTARYAAQMARDEITGQYPAEEAIALATLGPVAPDFKAWLIGHRQERPEP